MASLNVLNILFVNFTYHMLFEHFLLINQKRFVYQSYYFNVLSLQLEKKYCLQFSRTFLLSNDEIKGLLTPLRHGSIKTNQKIGFVAAFLFKLIFIPVNWSFKT